MLANTMLEGVLLLYVPFLISTTFHEAAHALTAKWGGDDTAYRGGQVSLNPIPHIQREPFGMVVLPLLLLFSSGFLIGWASAPIDPFWAARHPKRAALVSLAGPFTNFLLATVAFFALRYIVRSDLDIQEGSGRAVALITESFLRLNIILGIFNLIPLPPLDGAGALEGFFPRVFGNLYGILRSQPFIMLAVIYVVMSYGQKLYMPVLRLVQSWL